MLLDFCEILCTSPTFAFIALRSLSLRRQSDRSYPLRKVTADGLRISTNATLQPSWLFCAVDCSTVLAFVFQVTAWRYLLFAKLEILPALPKAKLHLSIAVSGKCHLPPCFNFAPGAAARLDAELAKLIRGLGNCRSEDSLAHFARRGVIMNEVYINQEAEPCVLEVDETLDLVGLNLQPANIVTNSKRGLVDSQSGQTKRRFADIQQDVLRDGLAGSKTHPLQISGAPIAGACNVERGYGLGRLPEAPDEEGPGPSKKNKTGQLSGAPLIEQSKPLVKRYLFELLPDPSLPSEGSQVVQGLFDFTGLKVPVTAVFYQQMQALQGPQQHLAPTMTQLQLWSHSHICSRQHQTCPSAVRWTLLCMYATSSSESGGP
ncbi:TPA: hypothetical protein ACH3X1_013343 [Trebouxia sp. C0004]